MNTRIPVILLGAMVSFAFSMSAQSLMINYTGSILSITGAFETLIPSGTPVSGSLSYDDFAVAGGIVGPGDIRSIDVSVGEFCFTTSGDTFGCPVQPGSYVPIASIDAAEITFAGRTPTGGLLGLTPFSPTFQEFIPIEFDLNAGLFFADGGALGTAVGTFVAVPEPSVVWLLGAGLIGLSASRRKRK